MTMKFYVPFFFTLIFQSLFIINASRFQRYGNLSHFIVASFDELNKFDAFNGTEIVDKNVEEIYFGDDELFNDESKVGTQKGKNVALAGYNEKINLSLINALTDSSLTFRFCTGVTGIIQICYDSTSPNSDLRGSCSPSQCELKVNIEGTAVSFNADKSTMQIGLICDNFQIFNVKSNFRTILNIETCPPKIENGIIHLDVKAAKPEHRIEVVDAEIKYPEIPTTPLPSTPKSAKSDPTSKSSMEWWGIVILVILALIIFGIVATFGFLCWKKRRSSKPAEETKPITVITDAKELPPPPTVQTASKTTRPDLNFTQFEPSKSQKKQ
uniref:Transmembrane protein n=1 Tax=Panagrolaimus sp. ES5 TaxID=591445 RepID=A0AC34FYB1_9BILA